MVQSFQCVLCVRVNMNSDQTWVGKPSLSLVIHSGSAKYTSAEDNFFALHFCIQSSIGSSIVLEPRQHGRGQHKEGEKRR